MDNKSLNRYVGNYDKFEEVLAMKNPRLKPLITNSRRKLRI